jgi:hypothetical protein
MALEDARVISHNQAPAAAPPGYNMTVYPQQSAAYTYPGQYMYGSQPPAVGKRPCRVIQGSILRVVLQENATSTTVDRQMLAIVLIWQVEKIAKLK